jgi:hypothetical protein
MPSNPTLAPGLFQRRDHAHVKTFRPIEPLSTARSARLQNIALPRHFPIGGLGVLSRFAAMPPTLRISSWATRARRRVACDARLPSELRTRLERGEVERLLEEGHRLQSKPRCEVARLDHPAGAMLLKRHTWGDARRTARMALRTPVARRCFEHGKWLIDRGISTPRPLALVEDRLGPLGLRSYLITKYVPGKSLFDLIRWECPPLPRCEQIAASLAQTWQRLIDLGVAHNDLKPENWIVDPHDQVWLIDLEKLHLRPNRKKLVGQHLTDAASFLHVRTWRDELAMAEVFRQALATTTLGNWAQELGPRSHPLVRSGYTSLELDLEFTTVVLAEQGTSPEAVEVSRESARLLSNRVVVTRGEIPRDVSTLWILLLRAGERISPDLARHLVEHLLAAPNVWGVEIPIVTCDAAGRRCHATDPLTKSGLRAVRTDFASSALGLQADFEGMGPTIRLDDAIEVVAPAVESLRPAA